MNRPAFIDARGWIGLGVFGLVILLLWMIAHYPALRADEFFKTIATLLIGAFVKDVVGWAYSATKQGGELAERAQGLVEQHATSNGEPQKVEVVNPPQQPVPTTDASAAAPAADEELPEYAR